MINYKDWNYQEMGFKNEQELKESYNRVMERLNNPKSETELEIERMNELKAELKANNNQLDTAKLREEARLQELDITVHNRIIYEREQKKRKEEQEKMSKFLSEVGESIKAEKEAEAARELQKEKERLEAELQKTIYSTHGVKTDKEKQRDEALSKLLKNL